MIIKTFTATVRVSAIVAPDINSHSKRLKAPISKSDPAKIILPICSFVRIGIFGSCGDRDMIPGSLDSKASISPQKPVVS